MTIRFFEDLNYARKVIENGMNVLLEGPPGCGKTRRSLDLTSTLGLKTGFLNAATIDANLHMIGIPIESKINPGTMDFIRPQEFTPDHGFQVMIFDEINRNPDPQVTNALLELIDQKSINGVPFPDLLAVVATMNPPSHDQNIQADELDDALYDRFHLRINVRNDFPLQHFLNLFPDHQHHVHALHEWMKTSVPDELVKTITNRRLERIMKMYTEVDTDVSDMIPSNCNPEDLALSFLEASSPEKHVVSTISSLEDFLDIWERDHVADMSNNNLATQMYLRIKMKERNEELYCSTWAYTYGVGTWYAVSGKAFGFITPDNKSITEGAKVFYHTENNKEDFPSDGTSVIFRYRKEAGGRYSSNLMIPVSYIDMEKYNPDPLF